MNIFVEGIFESDRINLIKTILKENKSYSAFLKNDISPIGLSYCAYMNEEKYNYFLEKYPNYAFEIKRNTYYSYNDFHYTIAYNKMKIDDINLYKELASFSLYDGKYDPKEFLEIVREKFSCYYGYEKVFESSLFENVIDELLLYSDYSDEDIVEFYEELVKNFNFKYFIYYIEPDDIKSSIIEKYNEEIIEVMIRYFKTTKYGKDYNVNSLDDLVKYFEKRIDIEKIILSRVFPKRCRYY